MHFYKNGNYVVCMMNDGTKIRKTDENKFIPDFSEGTDCLITMNCSQNCQFCYQGCKFDGKHGELLNWKFLDTMHPYTELSFNGNDMNHPQLEAFLVKLKQNKVFANMTVNQKQFMDNLDKIKSYVSSGLLYGIGVSYNHYDEDFVNEFKQFKNTVLHVINGIITVEDLEKLKGNNLKILILGYKNLRRGNAYLMRNDKLITRLHQNLMRNLKKIIDEKWFDVVSFDNLGITQLEVYNLMSKEEWKEFYMGDDGDYTFYIDLVNGRFAKNSCETKNTYEIGDKSMDEMFNIIRN